jgi:hypothetical protein
MRTWEDDVRFAQSQRRNDLPEPYQQIRKLRRWVCFWFLAAAAGWWLAWVKP